MGSALLQGPARCAQCDERKSRKRRQESYAGVRLIGMKGEAGKVQCMYLLWADRNVDA